MSFARCHLHIMRPGKLSGLNVESYGSMARFFLRDGNNSFTLGGSDQDYAYIENKPGHWLEFRLINNNTLEIKAKEPTTILMGEEKIEISGDGNPRSVPILQPKQVVSSRFKIIADEIIIRGEIFPEAEVLPPKIQKYLELQYGRFEKIAEGRSAIILLTKKNPRIIKLLRPSLAQRGVILRFINAARKFCVLPEHLFLPIQEIVYRKEFPLSYIVTKHFQGDSLENYLACKGTLPIQDTIYIIRSLAQNLMVLKSHNYCCRNLTPENIMIDESQRIYITGFFLLKSQDHTVTVPGAQMVIPKYTSPEQVDNPIKADILADVFSLGAIFYNCLLGDPPYNFSHVREYVNALKYTSGISSDEIQKKAPQFSKELCQLISKMLSFDKKDRPSPEQLLGHLSDNHLILPNQDNAEDVWIASDGNSQSSFEDDESAQSEFVAKDAFPTMRSNPHIPPLNSVESTIPVVHLQPSTQQSSPSSSTEEVIVASLADSSSDSDDESLAAQAVSDSIQEGISRESQSSDILQAISADSNEEQAFADNSTNNAQEHVADEKDVIEESFSLEENNHSTSASFSALLEIDENFSGSVNPTVQGFTLKVIQGPQNSRALEYHFNREQEVVIGREADFSIRSDSLISRAHARLEHISGEWWLTDLRSRNGVYIGDKKINREKVVPGTEFTVGETTLLFQENAEKQIAQEQDIPEDAMDSIREIRITRMCPAVKPVGSVNTKESDDLAPSIEKPMQQTLSESRIWQRPSEVANDEVDHAMEAVYKEFRQTSIVEGSRRSNLVHFKQKSETQKIPKILLWALAMLLATLAIITSFLFFFWKF